KKLRFNVLSIDRVFWRAPDKTIIEGRPPSVDEDGVLTWGSLRPPAQATYSITGRRVPEYFVYIDLPLDRPMHHGEPLPRRIVCRRFDLYGRGL
ncbi:MAG: hypothetical protein IBX56_17655, partial [Methylomicrobium sp.]|nr:hypothetical protein [Methylomicrobium sp.]